MPSPYGPRLPWHFPFSRSFWLSGDVKDGPIVMPLLRRLGSVLPWIRKGHQSQAYQQVQSLSIPT